MSNVATSLWGEVPRSEKEVMHDLEATMFEKPLTPSDVSKLNRLVIPKQYAERYFPMEVDTRERGLPTTLGFGDEAGKVWKFRYSYWTSSQSYVLTKGWSRYVKEKQLIAGDVVSFLRRCKTLLIRWRRPALAVEEVAVHRPPPSSLAWCPAMTCSLDPSGCPPTTGHAHHPQLFGTPLMFVESSQQLHPGTLIKRITITKFSCC